MVLRYSKDGFPYREPPYTDEEWTEIERRMSGVVAFTRPKGPEHRRQQDGEAESSDGSA